MHLPEEQKNMHFVQILNMMSRSFNIFMVSDMIYHETTYLDNMRDKAEARFHTTTRQAAEIARKAMVKKLLIGHFSSKYASLEPFITGNKSMDLQIRN
jgi:ribonuclease BN (tRNA processing enzyme)